MANTRARARLLRELGAGDTEKKGVPEEAELGVPPKPPKKPRVDGDDEDAAARDNEALWMFLERMDRKMDALSAQKDSSYLLNYTFGQPRNAMEAAHITSVLDSLPTLPQNLETRIQLLSRIQQLIALERAGPSAADAVAEKFKKKKVLLPQAELMRYQNFYAQTQSGGSQINITRQPRRLFNRQMGMVPQMTSMMPMQNLNQYQNQTFSQVPLQGAFTQQEQLQQPQQHATMMMKQHVPTCWTCGQIGHISPNCPNKSQNSQRKSS